MKAGASLTQVLTPAALIPMTSQNNPDEGMRRCATIVSKGKQRVYNTPDRDETTMGLNETTDYHMYR